MLHIAEVDAEAAVIAALRLALPPDVTVSTEIPRIGAGERRFPLRMVRVTRTGGTLFSPAHDRPLILVECWAASSVDAWELAGLCRRTMLGWSDELSAGAWLSHLSEGSGPVNNPDPGAAHARYQFLHELQIRAQGA